MTLINNKIKQFVKGNWGKPESFEHGLKLKHLEIEPRHIPGKKKKRIGKREFIFKGRCCPFCYQELPLDEVLIAKKKKECEGKPYGIWEEMYRVDICPKCKACEIDECPACKHKTWYREGWHKHQICGCGFEGKRLVVT